MKWICGLIFFMEYIRNRPAQEHILEVSSELILILIET